MTVVGYVRVSTTEQAVGGLGLQAQRAAIEGACRQHRWCLTAIHEDAGVSAKTNYRPGLARALSACKQNPGTILLVAKLDRLVRSLTGYASLVERAELEGWSFVALDTPETDTPHGQAMQGMTAIFAQLERQLISQRTREALSAARNRGVRLGRPPAVSDAAAEIVLTLGRAGWSSRAIARHLQELDVPAPHGGERWHPSTVIRLLQKLQPNPNE